VTENFWRDFYCVFEEWVALNTAMIADRWKLQIEEIRHARLKPFILDAYA